MTTFCLTPRSLLLFPFFSFFSFYDVGVVIFGDELGLVLFCLLCKILINLLVLSASILQIKVLLLVNIYIFFPVGTWL